MADVIDRDDRKETPETTRGPNRGRRRLMKGSIGLVGGLALSQTYVKPSMLSVQLHETAYASSPPPQHSQARDPKGPKPKQPKGPKS